MTQDIKVLFLSPGGLGSGEIINAVIVADQLRKKGVHCSFLTFPYGAQFIRPFNFDCTILGSEKDSNIEAMKKYIAHTCFDAIVIADYYLFQIGKMLPWFLWIGWMADLDVPIISFDSLYLGREFPEFAYIMNPKFYPQPKHNIKFRVPSFVELLIYPAPPFTTSQGTGDVCGRLYEESFLNYRRPPSGKEEIGINPEEKLILHIIPKWTARTVMEGSLMHFPQYYSMLATLLMHQLKNVDENIHIVCINPASTALYTQRDTVKATEMNFLPFDTYMKYVMAADLIVTDNILSATTWKAVLHRVPTLVLGNSLMARDAFKFDKIRETYPVSSEYMEIIRHHLQDSSRYLPTLSFWSYYTNLFRNIDIGKTFLIQELFDEKGFLETLEKVLVDENFKRNLRKNQDEYVRRISEIPTMAEIILSIAQSGNCKRR